MTADRERPLLPGLTDPWPLPEWLPDETFYSLVSRYHLLSGNRLPETTSTALFGRRRSGYQHDFPSPLNAFVERSHERLGNSQCIARDRTILPMYLVSRNSTACVDAFEALATGVQATSLKYQLGLLTSRFRANHPLKACRSCIAEDVDMAGIATWRRSHQFPGIWVCQRHREPLLAASLKSTGVHRFGWLLPEAAGLAAEAFADQGADVLQALLRFAQIIGTWAKQPTSSLPPTRLAQIARFRLLERGHRNRSQLTLDYVHAVAPLRVIPELHALPSTPAEAMNTINRWVFAPRGDTHPLRHLSLIFWLFEDWSEFEDTARRTTTEAACQPALPSEVALAGDTRRADLLRLMAEGLSISAAARSLGIATQTAIAWATAAGVTVPKRPKKIKPDKCASLIEDLRGGLDKRELAGKYGLSVESITRVLRSEIGLAEAWHATRHSKAQTEARTRWQAAISAGKAKGLKHIRTLEPAVFAWLYRNDRVWLDQVNKAIAPAPHVHKGLDWDARDTVLAATVQAVALALREGEASDGSHRPLRLWQLYQAIPELKAKLGAMHRLPLTQNAIRLAVTHGPQDDEDRLI